jgi:hypothetical protein
MIMIIITIEGAESLSVGLIIRKEMDDSGFNFQPRQEFFSFLNVKTESAA